MKKFPIIVVCLFVSFSLFAFDPKPNDVSFLTLLEYEGYKTYYNRLTKQPEIGWYTLTRTNAEHDVPNARPTSFHRDDRLVSLFKSEVPTQADYTNSGYDRGHIVPADDLDDNTNLIYETFVTNNISPQNSDLNQHGAWRELEKYGQQLAKTWGSVTIYGGPLFIGWPVKTIGSTRIIPVPTYFFKIFEYQGLNGTVYECYIVPNVGNTNRNINVYMIAFDMAEHLFAFRIR
jgi:endonuclease G